MPAGKKLRRIVDMHIHILPGVDDGAKHMVETMKMLKLAAREGITDMIVTPHYKEGQRNLSPEEILEAIRNVERSAKMINVGIRLYPGSEVYYFHGMEEELEAGKICTLNYTDYVLVEFSPQESFTTIWNAMDKLVSYGYSPILAHVERYQCMLDDWHNVKQLKRLNVGIQMNATAVTGEDGRKVKKLASVLLSNQIVDYIGTDAHHAKGSRTPQIKKCESLLLKKYDPRYVKQILYKNACDMID